VAGPQVARPEACERAVDDPAGEVGRADAESLDHPGAEALEHDVGVRTERAARLRIGLQVELDGLLAGVQRLVPGRRELVQRIAAGRLEPHDARAEAQQLAARERPRQVARQVDDEQARERLHATEAITLPRSA
jgi:hypothetical protein